MAPTHVFHPLPNPHDDNAAAITKLFAEGGPDTTVLLLPSTLYNLVTVINFCHPRTTLGTVGYPTFETGKQAILETRGDKEAGAIHMLNLSGTALKRVHIRGCRGWGRTKPESKDEEERLKGEGKLGWVEGGAALVLMGGPQSEDSVIEGCRLEDPRGWTAVHVCDWSQRPKVLNNIVGPCGQEASGGPWADGLSVAGKDSLISGNTVFDATDGAIVVFCAPGSTISDNTIIARGRDLLGAINMVDDFPFDRDFSNTRVVGNVIRTEGAYIRLGIGCGMTCWAPYEAHHRQNYGGHVLHNYLGPGVMGYGIALSSAKDFTVQGNIVVPGTSFSGDMGRNPWNAAPTAFLTEWQDRGRTPGCNLQEGFVEGEVSWLIGTEPGYGDKLTYEGGQLTMDVDGNSASGEGAIRVRGARWEVGRQGDLLLREEREPSHVGSGRILWESGNGGVDGSNPVLKFSMAGQLSIQGADGTTFWDPTAYIRPHLDVLAGLAARKPKPPKPAADHPSVIFAAKEPLLTILNPDGNILYATSYQYPRGEWELRGGQWISIAPQDLRGVVHGLVDAPSAPFNDGPPPLPTASRPHHFTSFIKDLASNLNTIRNSSQAPPPVPARLAPASNTCAAKPTFLFMDNSTAQLFLHSSPSPAHPLPEHTHWVGPEHPSRVDDAWFVFQGDGNGVMYAKTGDAISVPFATHTGGETPPAKIVLKGVGERDGPAMEMYSEAGERVFTTKR